MPQWLFDKGGSEINTLSKTNNNGGVINKIENKI
jgi:hypothetical protein